MAEGAFVPARVPSVRHSSHPGLLQRQCACGGPAVLKGECENCRGEKLEGMQMKLAVGRPGDSYEQEADRAADRVMSMSDAGERPYGPAPVTHVPVQAISRYSRGDGGGADAPAIVHEVVNSPGRPLDAGTRAFMESRFGHEFGRVRVHTDSRAAESARAVNALAYTVGSNVAFGAGMYAPGTESGRRLLAHELAHTIQQQAAPRSVQRRIWVDRPTRMIRNPHGKGVVQTNAATIRKYLTILCPTTEVDEGTGEVTIPLQFCTQLLKEGGHKSNLTATPTGCGCLCDLVKSPNQWVIKVKDRRWPNTDFDDVEAAIGNNEDADPETSWRGTGGIVTVPSPNSRKIWGASTVSGATLDVDPWLVLGHELCGHAWLGDKGAHAPGPDDEQEAGEQTATVAQENLIRQEHNIESRATFKQPNCGESYWRDRAAPAKVNWSKYWTVCQKWRRRYNEEHGTSYTMTDTIP